MNIKIRLIQYIKKFFNINSTWFKTTTLVIIMFYFLIIFKIVSTRFNASDNYIPHLQAITTEVLKKLGPFTVQVKVGMFIKNFQIFDIIKNNFLVDALIWFEFNDDEITLDTVENFSIDYGKIVYKSPPDIKVTDKQVFAKYNVRFELKTDLSFYQFPFEDHRLPILISNDFVTPDEMYYTIDASSFQIQQNIAPAGWRFSDMSVDAGFLPLQLDRQDTSKKSENPKALFVLNVVKASSRKALVIFLPLFASIFLSLLAFVMNAANVVGKFSLAITGVTALLGYRFVIEQMMPQVGYFTTTDSIYLFLLTFAFLNFAIQLLLTRYYMVMSIMPSSPEQKTSKQNFVERLETISSIIFLLMAFLLAIVITYIILII